MASPEISLKCDANSCEDRTQLGHLWHDLGGFHWEHEKYKIVNFAFGTIWVVVIGNMKIENIKYSTLLLG